MKRRSWGIPLPATAALLAILAAAVLPLSSAVICESYRSFTECEGKVTDSGYCAWTNGGCHAGKPLPKGVVAITSVGDEVPISPAPPQRAVAAAPAPAPAPETEGEQQAF